MIHVFMFNMWLWSILRKSKRGKVIVRKNLAYQQLIGNLKKELMCMLLAFYLVSLSLKENL
jgi:hypothetical protein